MYEFKQQKKDSNKILSVSILLPSYKYCVESSFKAFSKIITLMSHQSREVDLTLFDPSKD